jgi:hypothetical protein
MATKPRSTRRKPSPTLAALIASKKAPTTLLGDMQQHAVKKSQEPTDRRQDIIHPSEMAKEDWCPRQTTYRLRGIATTDSGEVHGYQMLTIFQEGHDIHSKWQTWLGEMGRLWGKWKCPVCKGTIFYTGPPFCVDCMSEHGIEVTMQYAEVPLDAEDAWMITGHADGAVPDLNAFIEIKSIGLGTVRMEEPALVKSHTVKTQDGKSVVDYDSLFKAIKRPFKSHRKQAAVYLAIAKHAGWDYDRMVFIYENKANQQVKEFTVPFDEELADELIDTAKDIKWAVEHNTDLPRPAEFSKDKKPCRECPWRTWCYAGEEDTTSEQASEPERDSASGGRVPRSQAASGSAPDRSPDSTRRRVPRSARGSDRTDRQRPDAGHDDVHEVGRVPEHTVGRSGGRRVVRRRVSEPRQGD